MRILKINSLPPVKDVPWIDRDHVMLHACFQLLQDVVEKEDILNHVAYVGDQAVILDEIRELYEWWLVRKDQDRDNDLDEEDDKMLIRLIKVRLYLWT